MKRIAVIRAIDWETMQAALYDLSVTVRPDADRVEGTLGIGNSPPQPVTGGVVCTVALWPLEVAYVEGLAPNLLVDWIQNETEIVMIDGKEVEQPVPWPSYTVTDDKGAVTTLWAGTIQ